MVWKRCCIVHHQWKMCRRPNAPSYPFCMLTIQLPSNTPTGPPPTILVLLWTKHPTEDSSAGKNRDTFHYIPNVMHTIKDIHWHTHDDKEALEQLMIRYNNYYI